MGGGWARQRGPGGSNLVGTDRYNIVVKGITFFPFMSGPASTFHKIESVGLRDRNLKKRTKNLEIEKEVVKS